MTRKGLLLCYILLRNYIKSQRFDYSRSFSRGYILLRNYIKSQRNTCTKQIYRSYSYTSWLYLIKKLHQITAEVAAFGTGVALYLIKKLHQITALHDNEHLKY